VEINIQTKIIDSSITGRISPPARRTILNANANGNIDYYEDSKAEAHQLHFIK